MQEQEQELVGGLLRPATSLDSRSWPQDNVQVTVHQQRVNHHNDSSMLFSTLLSTSSNFQPFTADHNFQMHVGNGQCWNWNWWGNVSENSRYWSAPATHATGTTFPYPPYHTTTPFQSLSPTSTTRPSQAPQLVQPAETTETCTTELETSQHQQQT